MKRRILSLLLALAVISTMIMAVPMTGYAASDTRDPYAIRSVDGDTETCTFASGSSSEYTNTDATTLVYGGLYDSDGKPAESGDTASFNIYPVAAQYESKAPGVKHSKDTANVSAVNKDLNNFKIDSTTMRGILVIQPLYDGTLNVTTNIKSDKKAAACQIDANTTSPTVSNGKLYPYTDSSGTSYEGKIKDYEVEANCLYVIGYCATNSSISSVSFTKASTEPTLSLSDDTLSVPNGGSKTLTASVENMGELTAADVTWTSSDESVATVSGGVVTGVANGTATITASITYSGTTYEKTCDVTVSNSSNVMVTIGHPITQATLSQDGTVKYTFTASGENTIDFGTYDLAYVNPAPMTYSLESSSDTVTIDSDTTALNLSTKVNTVDSSTFSDEIYEAVEGKTVKWGAYDSKWYPTSFGYLDSIQQSTIVPIAGSVDDSTSDSTVYATVENGKIHSYTRTGNFQFNKDTVFTVPATPGCTVTVVNYRNDTSEKNNNVYTIGDEQVGTLSDDGNTSVYEYTYTYSGTENGTVAITSLSGGYLSSITVTYPITTTTFGTTAYDSGYYYTGNDTTTTKYGAIRFFQEYSGAAVTEYGFVFVDSATGETQLSNKISATGSITADGIYGTLTEIAETNFTTKVYAQAYVTTASGTVYSDKVITAQVGSDPDWVYEPGTEPANVVVASTQGTKDNFGVGSEWTDSYSYDFVDTFTDTTVKEIFGGSADATSINTKYTEKYINYIGGTSATTHPTVTYSDLDAGNYTVYYLGYNSGKAVQMTVNGGDAILAGSGVDFATSESAEKTLKLYTMQFTLDAAGSATLVFDDLTSSYLPDLYYLVLYQN